jgi:hypothetical protein
MQTRKYLQPRSTGTFEWTVVTVILVLSDERQSSDLRRVCDMSKDRQQFLNSQQYGKSNDVLISNHVTDFFGPKVGTFTDYQRHIFMSSIIVRCGGDQVETYRWCIFWSPPYIPVIGDYLSFFVTSDIATISLFPLVKGTSQHTRHFLFAFFKHVDLIIHGPWAWRWIS